MATQNALRKIEEHEKGVCIQFVKSVSLDLIKRSFFLATVLSTSLECLLTH